MASSILGSISSQIPSEFQGVIPEPGKLVILPIKMIESIPIPLMVPFVAMFNPETYNEQINVQHDCAQAPGSAESEIKFALIEQSNVSFDLMIDGTGAYGGPKKDVAQEIGLFRVATGFNGDRHISNYLVLIWGSFIFYGFLKTLTITYTLFNPDGTPLRAKLSCAFTASTPKVLSLLNMALFSPDLSKEHLVKSTDRIDNLSQHYYETTRHHLSVAEANGLTSPRKLPEGGKLFFPPVEK